MDTKFTSPLSLVSIGFTMKKQELAKSGKDCRRLLDGVSGIKPLHLTKGDITMMNTSDLIHFICERNIILCGFVDKLRAAGFDLDYRTEVLSASDSYLEATDFLLKYQYDKC